MKFHFIFLILSLMLVFGCIGQEEQLPPEEEPVLDERLVDIVTNDVCFTDSPISKTVSCIFDDKDQVMVWECAEFESDQQKDTCYSIAAEQLMDSSLCEKSTDIVNKDICYFNYAVKNKDADICTKISSTYPEISMSCYHILGAETGKAHMCDEDIDTYEWCIMESAINSGNKELCGDITVSGLKNDYCLYAVENASEREGYCDSGEFYFASSSNTADALRWMQMNHPGSTILSWWDYGELIECFSEYSVLSREDTIDNPEKIIEFAYLLSEGTEDELTAFMKKNNAEYLLLNDELAPLGKWSAVNYLGCVYMNQSGSEPYLSECEAEHSVEILEPSEEACSAESIGGTVYYSSFGREYCVWEALLGYSAYDLQSNSTVDASIYDISSSSQMLLVLYSPSIPERKGKFYDSNFNRAYTDSFENLTLVYSDRHAFIYQLKLNNTYLNIS
ncbi:hypothetical protein JXB01_04775 [Candidatus Micrarchaeota archaeon]|nr:hypothetical protein [Candidatus Micrarchaeota archaeon]